MSAFNRGRNSGDSQSNPYERGSFEASYWRAGKESAASDRRRKEEEARAWDSRRKEDSRYQKINYSYPVWTPLENKIFITMILAVACFWGVSSGYSFFRKIVIERIVLPNSAIESQIKKNLKSMYVIRFSGGLSNRDGSFVSAGDAGWMRKSNDVLAKNGLFTYKDVVAHIGGKERKYRDYYLTDFGRASLCLKDMLCFGSYSLVSIDRFEIVNSKLVKAYFTVKRNEIPQWAIDADQLMPVKGRKISPESEILKMEDSYQWSFWGE